MAPLTPVNVICSIVVRSPFDAEILPAWQNAGHEHQIQWLSTSAIMDAVRSGYRADVAIVTREAMDELIERGIVDGDSRIELVESKIGLAVKAGESHPPIATPDDLINTLRQARSVAYSLGGASGIYFQGLIKTLAIEDEVKSKASTVAAGFTAEKLITGEASLAVQQFSELLMVPGIEIVGPLPEALQKVTAFSAALFNQAADAHAAQAFLCHLQSAISAAAFEAKGLDPLF